MRFNPFLTQQFIYPALDEPYCFRAYPRKFDLEFLDKLPDANTCKYGDHYAIAILPEISIFLDGSNPPKEEMIKRVIFRKVSLGYQREGTFVCCYDWEQLY